MAKDLGDVIGHAVGRVAREAVQTVSSNARKASNGPLSGPKGLAAGAGLVALAPLAAKGAGKLVKQQLANGGNPVAKAKEAVGGGVKDAVGNKIDQAGGAAGMAKEAAKGVLPGGGGGDGDGDKEAGAQIGHTRRMPIQQAIDVAVPIETAYNQWTQFEDWPNFMHRVDRVSQEDETHVSFKAKIWGISREFTAEIVEQRPDDRIKWRVTEGVSHTGVVTFHELSDRLTRVDVDIDIQPGSLLEKAGRGMRHAKRAIRADLSRFKAYVELEEDETGAWRGEIEDGDVKRKRSGSSSSNRGQASKSSKASSSGRSSRAAAARSDGSSRTAKTRAASSGSKSSGRSSGGSSSGRSSGGSSSGRSSGGSSSGRSSGGSSSGRSSGGSSGASNGASRSSSRAKTSSNGTSGSRSTRKKTASSRS
jgi:uncharacterized membrane protein